MNGIIVVDKPEGITSFKVISRLRGITGQKRIGHGGTLDPMATGVLPVFFGKAARCCDILENTDKTYIGKILLGTTTDTEDITGEILKTRPVNVTAEQVADAVESFKGNILQVPPMYSAVWVDGKRLYDLARKGKTVERQGRPITVYDIKVLSFSENSVEFMIDCSKGTFVRTIAKDIGEKLGCGGCLSYLRRVKSGTFTIDEALTLEKVKEFSTNGELESKLICSDRVFSGYNKIQLDEIQTRMFLNGVFLDVDRIPDITGGTLRVYGYDGRFLGIAENDGYELVITKVLGGYDD